MPVVEHNRQKKKCVNQYIWKWCQSVKFKVSIIDCVFSVESPSRNFLVMWDDFFAFFFLKVVFVSHDKFRALIEKINFRLGLFSKLFQFASTVDLVALFWKHFFLSSLQIKSVKIENNNEIKMFLMLFGCVKNGFFLVS
jgi:hypothetical protein